MQAIAFNYLTAFVLGGVVNGASEGLTTVPAVAWWLSAVVLGVMFMGAFVLMARSTARSGVTITTAASRVSLVLPVVGAWLLWPEGESVRWTAIAVIVCALVLMLVPRAHKVAGTEVKDNRPHGGMSLWLYPLGVWVLFGLNNFGLKWAQERFVGPEESAAYSAMIFLFAGVAAWLWWLVGSKGPKRVTLRNMGGGVALGVANFGVTYFMLRGLAQMSATTFFPIYHTSIVALVAMVGVGAFGERVAWWQIVGLVMAAAGEVMMFV